MILSAITDFPPAHFRKGTGTRVLVKRLIDDCHAQDDQGVCEKRADDVGRVPRRPIYRFVQRLVPADGSNLKSGV